MFYPVENINSVVSRVMFPHYSRLQDDNEKLRMTHMELVTIISFITFPLMLFIIATSDILTLTVFGVKWEPVVPILMILAPVGMIQSVYSPAGAIYQAKGRTDWWFKWGAFTGIFFVIAFIIGIKWGIIGVALAFLIANIITIYPGLYIPFKLIGLSVKAFIISFKRTFYISFCMSIIVFGMKLSLINILGYKITFIASIVIGSGFYILFSSKYNSTVFRKTIDFIKTHD
jgi:PST family polysaccharide transporter